MTMYTSLYNKFKPRIFCLEILLTALTKYAGHICDKKFAYTAHVKLSRMILGPKKVCFRSPDRPFLLGRPTPFHFLRVKLYLEKKLR